MQSRVQKLENCLMFYGSSIYTSSIPFLKLYQNLSYIQNLRGIFIIMASACTAIWQSHNYPLRNVKLKTKKSQFSQTFPRKSAPSPGPSLPKTKLFLPKATMQDISDCIFHISDEQSSIFSVLGCVW